MVEFSCLGGVRNMSRSLFAMNHLGALYMANNQISRIPAGIASLKNLTILDLSSNRLRVLPPEIGLLMQLRHLYLQQNLLRTLPFELGRLYKLSTLGKCILCFILVLSSTLLIKK
jgi:CCR4-NOT transcription complex subunit 6